MASQRSEIKHFYFSSRRRHTRCLSDWSSDVCSSDLQGTSLARYFVRNFSGSRYQDVKLAEEFAKPLEKRTAVDDSWARSESVIAIGFNAPPGGDEDAAALTVLETYVGGVDGRLAEPLRDQEGLGRTVDARYQPRVRA